MYTTWKCLDVKFMSMAIKKKTEKLEPIAFEWIFVGYDDEQSKM